MQQFISNVNAGSGCRINRKSSAPTFAQTDVRRRQEAEKLQQEIADKMRQEEADWAYRCLEIIKSPPTGVIEPEDGHEAIIYVETLEPDKPLVAYVLLRILPGTMPNLPKWYLGKYKRFGLKGFLNKWSRNEVLKEFPEDGEVVMLNGKVKVIGVAASRKSVHVEFVEGFRLR